MSDRLTELQRQRALAQEQLAWFDREIARETGQAPAPVAPAMSPVVPLAAMPDTRATLDAVTARAADEIIAQYKEKGPAGAASDAKKGCWLWFLFALGMFAICVVSLYFIYDATK